VNVKIPIFPLCIWLTGGLCCASARGQVVAVHSSSGQFTARQLQRMVFLPAPARPIQSPVAGGLAYLLSSKALPALGNNDEVALEPSTLVVSCERLKALVLDKLGLVDRWQGRIDLTINPALAEDKGPQLTATRWPQGWTYELELPRNVQEEILMRSLIQTLLLEIANRQAGVQSAEIPLWLVEGMSADLQANNFPTFIVQSGQSWSANVVWNKGSEMMPSELRQHTPLSFQQLSWPQASDLTAEGLPLYRSCAQLFLEELLRFNDGRACLRTMITQLPEHWNWQTTFLLAFHSHFEQLLEVEKWWGVSYVDFTRGYKAQLWSAADCRKKLQDSLDVPVEVHFGADQMPVEAKITLQEVIRQWAPADVLEAVQRAIGGLKFLVPRATPELRPLAELYLKTLLDYLSATRTAGLERQLGKHAPSFLSGAKFEAIQQLDALDRQREAMWSNAVSNNPPQLSAAGQPEAKSADGH
jgi:hypothetical protein